MCCFSQELDFRSIVPFRGSLCSVSFGDAPFPLCTFWRYTVSALYVPFQSDHKVMAHNGGVSEANHLDLLRNFSLPWRISFQPSGFS
jgi:hypothetical protein